MGAPCHREAALRAALPRSRVPRPVLPGEDLQLLALQVDEERRRHPGDALHERFMSRLAMQLGVIACELAEVGS